MPAIAGGRCYRRAAISPSKFPRQFLYKLILLVILKFYTYTKIINLMLHTLVFSLFVRLVRILDQ